MKELFTAQSLWSDFDPNSQPLDVTVIKTEQIGNVTLEHVYFNGRKIDNEVTRVFGVVAFTTNSQACMVVVNKVNLPIDINTLCYWANNGYVAISIDYYGENSLNQRYTIYPLSLDYDNYVRSGRHRTHCDENAKCTVWYDYTVNTMRAVTFLIQNKHAEEGKIYLYSVGNASKIAVMCLAVDKRLTSGAVLFGNIWEEYEEIDTATVVIEDEKEEITKEIEMVEEQERWLLGICPQSYLGQIACPTFVVIGSNSTVTDMDMTTSNMPRILNRNSRCLIIPHMLGTVTTTVRRALNDWFISITKQKSPSLPKISITSKQGKVIANVKTTCDKLDLYYSRGAKGNNLNWVKANSIQTENGYTHTLEVFDENIPIKVYANVTTFDNFTMSSDVTTFIPKDVCNNIKTLHPTKVIYTGVLGKAEFTAIDVSESNFVSCNDEVKVAKGFLGICGVSGKKFGTFALSESKLIRNSDSVLTFDAFSEVAQFLNVYIIQNWAKHDQRKYLATINLFGGQLWQKITIDTNGFVDENGKTIQGENVIGLDFLAFDAEQNIIVNNILFT